MFTNQKNVVNLFFHIFTETLQSMQWSLCASSPFKAEVLVVATQVLPQKGRNSSKFMPVAEAIILQKMPRFSWGFNKEFHATSLDMQTHSVRNNFPCGFLGFSQMMIEACNKKQLVSETRPRQPSQHKKLDDYCYVLVLISRNFFNSIDFTNFCL